MFSLPPQLSQKKISLVIGIVLALIALMLVNVYLQERAREAELRAKKKFDQRLANQTPVLVAKKDIPRGAPIEAEALDVQITPNQYVQPQAVTTLDRVAGMVAMAPISKGEQVILSKLAWAKDAGESSLAMATPVGKRAITISVDQNTGVAGMIRPGDYVDVIATVPVPVKTPDGKQAAQAAVFPLFQNVLVLAVGQDMNVSAKLEAGGRYKKQEKKESSPLITLALTSQEANLIAFVQENGRMRLVLRSPTDSQIEPVQPASWDTLFQYVLPKEMREPPKEKEKEPEGPTIEIYRGLSKDRVPITK